MRSKKLKRCLSFALACILAVSLLPVSALGAEAEETYSKETADIEYEVSTLTATEATTVPKEPEESENLRYVQAKINDILTRYLGGTEVSVTKMEATVSEMDWETYQSARYEIYELDQSDEALALSDEDTDIIV